MEEKGTTWRAGRVKPRKETGFLWNGRIRKTIEKADSQD